MTACSLEPSGLIVQTPGAAQSERSPLAGKREKTMAELPQTGKPLSPSWVMRVASPPESFVT